METGKASKTALRVAIRRAAHQLMEQPRILEDPIAVRLIGSEYARDLERASHKVARDFRSFMAVRSRYVEDRLAESVSKDVQQYVILGAGLDTFAYRNPFPELRVFEVDFPATQEWKRAMLDNAAIAVPDNVTYVALDFEHKTLAAGLAEAGFNGNGPAFFGWLGVVPYLTLAAFRSTLDAIAQLPAGSTVSFDYAVAPETLSPAGRTAFDALAGRVAAAGEPFQLFFTPQTMESELRRAGFHRIEQLDSDHLNEMYFKNRTDGLKLSAVKLGMLVTAGV
ncbi:MAG: class I SAM-dependent methyltransferase [Terracidiphilus sp.]|jgi:methyltransferase (TIGR00027 family)